MNDDELWCLRASSVRLSPPGDPAVRVDLRIDAGRLLGVVGAPGTDTSVLGRVLAGLVRPAAGSVHVAGHDVVDLVSTRAGRSVLRRSVRHVGPDVLASFEPDRTMRDALRLPVRVLRRVTGTMADVQIDTVLGQLWLDPCLASFMPHELSFAHLRLFALARALVVQPRLVVWQEPDDVPPAAQAALLTASGRHNRDHGTGFVVLARRLPWGGPLHDRLTLRDGRLVADTMSELARAA